MNYAALESGIVVLLNVSAMFAMGLTLTLAQIFAVLRQRSAVAIGLAVNLIAVPVLALLIVWGASLPAAIALGFLLCAAAPGGNTGPLLTANATGDIAYAVCLVMILSFASLLTIPIYLAAFVRTSTGFDMVVPVGTIILLILTFHIAPLCLGMFGHWMRPQWAKRAAPWVRLVANFSLAALTGVLLARHGHLLFANGVLPVALMALFVVALLLSGLLLGPLRQERPCALAMTTCTRNMSLALLLGAHVFEDPQTLIVVLTYGLLWVTAAVPAGLWMRRPQMAPRVTGP